MNATDITKLVNYLNDGGSLYIEGADVAASTNQELLALLGINRISVGTPGAVDELIGESGGFGESYNFEYSGGEAASYNLDDLGLDSAEALFSSQDDIVRAALIESRQYKAISTSAFFGALVSDNFLNSKASLMACYLTFLLDRTEPIIFNSSNEIAFGEQYINYPSQMTVTIENVGKEPLEITNIETSSAHFDYLGDTTYTLAFGEKRTLEVIFTATATGSYTDNLTITSNASNGNTYQIALSAECYSPPISFFQQLQYNVVVAPEQTVEEEFLIKNLGLSDLRYSLEFVEEEPDVRSTQKPYIELEKGQINRNPGYRGTGGPDEYGYEWIDSDEPNGPEFNFEDISTNGIPATDWSPTGTFDPLDEGYAGPYDMGFDFKFYGTPYSQIYFGSNGLISFMPFSADCYGNQDIPNADIPNCYIAPFWRDLDGSNGGNIYYLNRGSEFIIQYTDWPFYGGGGSVTFQVVLKRSGSIMIYYDDLTASSYVTIGIENQSGDDGLAVAFNEDYAEEGLAVKISAGPGWIDSNQYSGTIEAGNESELTFQFIGEGLDLGTYNCDLNIFTNEPDNHEYTIPIVLHVSNDDVFSYGFDVMDESNNPVSSAVFTLTNQDNDPNHIYCAQSNASGMLNIGYLFNGTYDLLVQHPDFIDYSLNNIMIDSDSDLDVILEALGNHDTPALIAVNSIKCYPNPFNYQNSRSMITLNLNIANSKENDITNLSVYNVKGQLVKTLINEPVKDGNHVIQWDGKDKNNKHLASGIYFTRLKNSTSEKTSKLLIIK